MVDKLISLVFYLDPACNKSTLGDGICDDDNNVQNCYFDWNDCCLEWHIDDSRCTDCTCHKLFSKKFPNQDSTEEERVAFKNMIIEKEAAIAKFVDPRPDKVQVNKVHLSNYGIFPRDRICHGIFNLKAFAYDGLDCCFAEISSLSTCNNAIGDCTCHMSGKISPIGGEQKCPERYGPLINDGKCQEFTNHKGCQFDGIDCCLETTLRACRDRGTQHCTIFLALMPIMSTICFNLS